MLALHTSHQSLPPCTGSGKTTLLDILAGRKSTSGGIWSGDVSIDGVKFSTYHLQRSVGYIMQDDVMMGTQTVREYLLFQTRMRLPPHLSAMDRYSRVQHVIEDLGLTRVANTRIGDAFMRGLSGGEKRRVSYVCYSHHTGLGAAVCVHFVVCCSADARVGVVVRLGGTESRRSC